MAFKDRIPLIKKIEEHRQSKVICFLTSIRPNLNAQISEDVVRVFFDHMLLMPQRPVKKIDIFICSNGGSGTVPWRLVALLREYTDNLGVIVPYRCYSAATLIALGANEIVMHPFAEMGPIDPTVSNAFNPVHPQTNQVLGIGVEDVKAYISFIKSTVGIHHEDELVKTIEILAQKVHPLALGNVERFISQSRLIARKILLTHMKGDADHTIDEIIENLASKLYFHGHPINRKEARDELKLNVLENPPPELETAIWQLYEDFESELENRIPFDPLGAVLRAAPAPQPSDPANPRACIVLPGVSTEMEVITSMVESAVLCSRFRQELRFVVAGNGANLEPIIRQETLAQEWQAFPAP